LLQRDKLTLSQKRNHQRRILPRTREEEGVYTSEGKREKTKYEQFFGGVETRELSTRRKEGGAGRVAVRVLDSRRERDRIVERVSRKLGIVKSVSFEFLRFGIEREMVDVSY